jgi:hypothetical protein
MKDDFKTDICRSLYIGIQKFVESRKTLSHDSMIDSLLESSLISDNVKHYIIGNIYSKKGNVIELLSCLSTSRKKRLDKFRSVARQYIKRLSYADLKSHLKPSTLIIHSDGNVVYFRGF